SSGRIHRGEHDVVAILEELEHAGKVVQVGGVVGLDRHDRVVVVRLPQRRPKTGVERRPETLVLPVADDGEMKPVAVSVDVIDSAVGGAVVDEDHARAELVRARAEILEQAADVLGLVEGWNDEPDHGRPINGAWRAELSSQPSGRPHLLAPWWE